MSLTQVKKKDREWKEGLVSQIQRQLDTYPTVYLLQYENFRNEAFKSLREKVRDSSTFCLGSNKVLKVALGKSEAEEYRSNLHLLANDIGGNSALLFTRLPQADVERMVASFEVLDYARAGAPATEEFAIPAGPVLQYGDPIAHTMEPTLRKHGMPTKLNKGVVELLTDFTVCRGGRYAHAGSGGAVEDLRRTDGNVYDAAGRAVGGGRRVRASARGRGHDE